MRDLVGRFQLGNTFVPLLRSNPLIPIMLLSSRLCTLPKRCRLPLYPYPIPQSASTHLPITRVAQEIAGATIHPLVALDGGRVRMTVLGLAVRLRLLGRWQGRGRRVDRHHLVRVGVSVPVRGVGRGAHFRLG